MPPASRIGDNHTCPMVNPGPTPHVGGPIISGMGSVLIGNKPAARVGDKATCQAPPDTISMGAPSVLIGNKMAARIGDSTVHGGVIVAGETTVIIGSSPQGAVMKAAAKSGVAFCEECARRKAEQRAREMQRRRASNASAHQDQARRPAATTSAPRAQGGNRAINVDRAVEHLDGNASARSQGHCLRNVREAIQAGGGSTGSTLSARDFGPNLERAGFSSVADHRSAGYTPQRGDVAVFQAVPGHPHGHIAMYNGQQWVSDYRQDGFYANQAYRSGSWTAYRP